IPQEIIDKILATANIVEVIGEYVKLAKRGVNHVGCCPFHDEKTASFTVSPAKGLYKCFGCGASGSVFMFLQEHEHISFPEAVRIVAKKYNIEVPSGYQPSDEERAKYARRESLKVATAWAQQYFSEQVEHGGEYLRARSFKPDTIKTFGLGFAPGNWHALEQAAIKAGYKKEVLLAASLIGEGERGTFDYFRNRIIFPISDVAGTVVGFTGRALNADEKAKYLNSRDSELFNKGRCLFGIHLAKKSMVQCNECIIVEGNFDVLRMHELGYTQTVAPCGTALTKEQIALIRRFTTNVKLIYDGDAAGLKAARKNAELLLAEGMNTTIVLLPEGDDPDSLGLKVPGQLKKVVDKPVGIIEFIHRQWKPILAADPTKELEAINDAGGVIAAMSDDTARTMAITNAAKLFALSAETVKKAVAGQKIERVAIPGENGWIGLKIARGAIKEKRQAIITADYETFVSQHTEGKENIISFRGTLEHSHLQELCALTRNVFILDEMDNRAKKGKELPEIDLCKRFTAMQCNVIVEKTDRDEWNFPCENFIIRYARLCRKDIFENSGNEALRRQLIEECAALLSRSDQTTITINTKEIAVILGIKETDFKKILKPFLEKKKTRGEMNSEAITVDGERIDFDPDRLPGYVDLNFFRRWGYFPAQKNGRKIFYVFRTNEGGLMNIGNFYMEPLFHVYDPDPNRNKRIVQINNAESGATFFSEFISGNLIEFGAFKKFLFNEGGNVFSKGKSFQHEIIMASIANEFPKCYELNTFGQQHEGFYAFTNAIFHDGKIEYTNELGLVKHQDKTYYSPAFSKIYSAQRKDNDKYENDRWFIYRETNAATFEEWSQLMAQVYKMNSNGHWAVLYAIMAAFRSIIYPIDRLFTAPFFIGPTESGKSQIAISIRALFMSPEAPLFNLNSGTDAAFFTTMERFRDVVQVYEEYNDYQISDTKFQGLKAAVYDGEGKQKKKDATSKDLDVSKVNCAITLLGQEAPQRDDGSLANRCVLLLVPKKDDWAEQERELFDKLKSVEKAGLSNVLIEVLKQRDIVQRYYQKTQRACYKEIKNDLSEAGATHQSRILNTVSLFLAICKLWEEYVPTLRLPFSYAEFYAIARSKIIEQSESLSQTNRLSVFFDTLQILLNRTHNGIQPEHDYRIEIMRKITVMRHRKETYEMDLPAAPKVLLLRVNTVHQLYADIQKSEALTMTNLLMYLKDHPAYIGQVKSARFTWNEYTDHFDELTKQVKRIEKKASATTSCVAMNYDLLKELSGIDLEKYEDPVKPFDTPPASPDAQLAQTEMPF
ncbi:MAG: DNA primase, partial [Prevotellaceae bacterium]|nr:DNA primase [Prevotellaceae bacterium]